MFVRLKRVELFILLYIMCFYFLNYRIGDYSSPVERITEVVRWYMSGKTWPLFDLSSYNLLSVKRIDRIYLVFWGAPGPKNSTAVTHGTFLYIVFISLPILFFNLNHEFGLTAFHAGRNSSVAKKPYNPILGETFQCVYDIPGETNSDEVCLLNLI